jgi:hypothetical protein
MEPQVAPEIRMAWVAVSAHLQAALGALSAADLAQPNAHRFPIPDNSRLAFHDSGLRGQRVGRLALPAGSSAWTVRVISAMLSGRLRTRIHGPAAGGPPPGARRTAGAW